MTRIEPARRTRLPLIAPLIALMIDVALVLVFAGAGRGSHGEDVLAGLVGTAWPFLLGLGVGWAVARLVGRGSFDPGAPVPTGALIWAGTLVVGMLTRALVGQGVAVSFVIVAAIVLVVLAVIVWRGLPARLDTGTTDNPEVAA